jgi:hypothetical protein
MFIEIFALVVIVILIVAALAIVVLLGSMPGRIAKQRNHPQADAIRVCGWWGVLTMGLLLPLAYIWAYTNPRWRDELEPDANQTNGDEKP